MKLALVIRIRAGIPATEVDKRRVDAFSAGMGVEPPQYQCAECGYASDKRRNFVRTGEGDTRVCSTGHYETPCGETRRQRNSYAKPIR